MTIMLTTSLIPEERIKAKEMQEISGFEYKPLTIGKLEKMLKKHFSIENAFTQPLPVDEA